MVALSVQLYHILSDANCRKFVTFHFSTCVSGKLLTRKSTDRKIKIRKRFCSDLPYAGLFCFVFSAHQFNFKKMQDQESKRSIISIRRNMAWAWYAQGKNVQSITIPARGKVRRKLGQKLRQISIHFRQIKCSILLCIEEVKYYFRFSSLHASASVPKTRVLQPKALRVLYIMTKNNHRLFD